MAGEVAQQVIRAANTWSDEHASRIQTSWLTPFDTYEAERVGIEYNYCH
jgi:hypothetical protein